MNELCCRVCFVIWWPTLPPGVGRLGLLRFLVLIWFLAVLAVLVLLQYTTLLPHYSTPLIALAHRVEYMLIDVVLVFLGQ